jgi:hypothetical protein
MNNFIRQEIFFLLPHKEITVAGKNRFASLELKQVIDMALFITICCSDSINFRVAKSNQGVAGWVFLFRLGR